MLEVGSMAPDFSLPDQDGVTRKLSDYRGKRVILYFYPKDNTPGCTKEACSLRDEKENFEGINAVIIGVSRDSAESHQRFIKNQNLNFTLLSDSDHSVMEQYGAWGEKKMYGKTTLGVIRCTYIINPEGIIEKTFPKVITATHGEQIRKYFDSLNK